MIEDAIWYAQLGYGVLPCNEKVPATRRGLKDGTTDPERIREMFQAGHNIGLIAPANVLVIDFDVSKDDRVPLAQRKADTRQRLLVLQDTFWEAAEAPLHATPSGGFHLFLRLPEGAPRLVTGPWPRGASITFGDLRGMARAYVVAPPSRTSKGQYLVLRELVPAEDLPLASRGLMEYLSPPERKRKRHRVTQVSDSASLAAQVAAVRAAPEGNRNNTLNRSAFIAGLLVAAGQVAEEQAREELTRAGEAVGLTATEVRHTLASGLKAGIHEGGKS